MSIRQAMIEALEKKYEAELASADATIKIYLEKRKRKETVALAVHLLGV